MLAGEHSSDLMPKRLFLDGRGNSVRIEIEIRPALIVAVAVLLQQPPPVWVSLIVLLILVAQIRKAR